MPASAHISPSDLRRHQRQPTSGRITLSWTDARGINCVARGECLNISPTGISVELREMLAARTYVSLQCPPHGIRGSGSVRYCFRTKLNWTVGIEFSGGLAWTERP